MNRMIPRLLKIVAALAGFYLIGVILIWDWMICRIEVPAGYSLRLRYKYELPFGGTPGGEHDEMVKLTKSGRPERLGVLEEMPGPGRHFYNPIEYEAVLVRDIVIKPGELGVVTSKIGKRLPDGALLADGPGYQGTRRAVLTPGRYRINPYGFSVATVKVSACVNPNTAVNWREKDPTLIPPGYVGVVTNNVENDKEPKGIQDNVLQPGMYYLNPLEKQIDIVSIGFNETTLTVEATASTESTAQPAEITARDRRGDRVGLYSAKDPAYVHGKGIEFPSNDGFTIHMDYTAIWGIEADQAPDVVRQFGTLKDVDQKVILPQIGSICRMHGSKRGAVDLLVGDKREEFQTDTAEELERVLVSKNLKLLFGLTRHIYVPAQVREPIQRKHIADELTKTREQEQLTARAEADLTEAKAKVVLEERRTKAETMKLVAETSAEGDKKAKQIAAETEKLKAEIDAKTAKIQAQITTTMGEAEAKRVELSNQAEADRYRQYVETLGGPDAYNRYVFAEGLPQDMKLGMFYAGPGTFWTDLKGIEQVLLGKMASDTSEKAKTPATAGPAR
jgi:hypothetical protein